MTKHEYRTSPDHETTGWPKGVPYIVGNEACERFSYYGMRAILTVHLVSLYVLAGQTKEAAEASGAGAYHLFAGAVYAIPMVGAILADRVWGKYRTILWLSLAYCVGHGVLALADIPTDPNTRLNLMYVGLGFIAVGAGGIKPCVSANVGDQFGRGNWFRVRSVYQIFYFSINFGSFFATIMIPWIRGDGTELWRTSLAFGIPGILMGIATLFFWMGRHKFVHVPPQPGGQLGRLDTLSGAVMFGAIGHWFITPADWGLALRLVLSLVFLVAGMAIFFYRQNIQQDDGFLAIVLYNLRAHLTGKATAQGAGAALGSVSTPVSAVAEGTPGQAVNDTESPLITSRLWSRFWAPAIERFGLEAAEGPHAVFKVCTIFIFIPAFWAIFDQHGSTWILQAQQMDTTMFGINVRPEQVSAANPLMVMALIPVMGIVYSLCDKIGFRATALRRMVAGLFVAGASFAIAAMIQSAIDTKGPGQVSIWWQVLAYLVLTTSEVLVSITALEFAYTQAPKRMKSVVMGLFLLTITLGNAGVSWVLQNLDLPPSGAGFFWLFAIVAAATAVLMGIRAYFYQPRDFPQD